MRQMSIIDLIESTALHSCRCLRRLVMMLVLLSLNGSLLSLLMQEIYRCFEVDSSISPRIPLLGLYSSRSPNCCYSVIDQKWAGIIRITIGLLLFFEPSMIKKDLVELSIMMKDIRETHFQTEEERTRLFSLIVSLDDVMITFVL